MIGDHFANGDLGMSGRQDRKPTSVDANAKARHACSRESLADCANRVKVAIKLARQSEVRAIFGRVEEHRIRMPFHVGLLEISEQLVSDSFRLCRIVDVIGSQDAQFRSVGLFLGRLVALVFGAKLHKASNQVQLVKVAHELPAAVEALAIVVDASVALLTDRCLDHRRLLGSGFVRHELRQCMVRAASLD
jgi:hypothetical protein